MLECIAATSWWLCPKKALEEIGGFDNINSHQDATLILKLISNGFSVYRVPEILLNYYVHNGEGITKISNEWILDDIEYRKKCREKMGNFSVKDKKEVEYKFSERIANMYIIIGDCKNAKPEIFNMLKIRFFSKNTYKIILKMIFRKIYMKQLKKKKEKR